jgi:PPOX class probable F420-dependent enzyme
VITSSARGARWYTSGVGADAKPLPSRTLRGPAVLSDPLVRELLGTRLVGVLATLEPDGAVHAVPLWLCDGGEAILLATFSGSRKARNLARDPRATLVLHDSRPGFEVCGVTIRGRVEIVRGDAATQLVERVHRRYLTDSGYDLDAARDFLAGDDVALRFVPEVAATWDERANPANAALRDAGGAHPLEPTTARATSAS